MKLKDLMYLNVYIQIIIPESLPTIPQSTGKQIKSEFFCLINQIVVTIKIIPLNKNNINNITTLPLLLNGKYKISNKDYILNQEVYIKIND